MNPNVKRHDDGQGWIDLGGIYRRDYDSYTGYLERQASKLTSKLGWCKKRNEQLRQRLQSRLKGLRITKQGMAVLCLGARLGGEVEAFIKMGAYAIGLDINPGEANQYVLHGDFHHLQFADSSIDLIYINCFDHCMNPDRVLEEIHRVLRLDGILQMECKAGSNETEHKSMGSDAWDCLEWDSMEVLVERIENAGFTLTKRYLGRSRALPYGYLFRRV